MEIFVFILTFLCMMLVDIINDQFIFDNMLDDSSYSALLEMKNQHYDYIEDMYHVSDKWHSERILGLHFVKNAANIGSKVFELGNLIKGCRKSSFIFLTLNCKEG